MFKNKTNLIPLNYVNTDPFSSATIKVTTVKNNRKRVNGYEYIKAKNFSKTIKWGKKKHGTIEED